MPSRPRSLHDLVERLAVGLDVRAVADVGVVAQHGLEQVLALLERHVDEQLTVEVEQVEDVVDDRRDEVRVAVRLAAARALAV